MSILIGERNKNMDIIVEEQQKRDSDAEDSSDSSDEESRDLSKEEERVPKQISVTPSENWVINGA